ncbi:TRAM domain-containing protein [Natronomonas salina]|uniref:TRAM domain-containing protein n=1 Tax=Natronomonas salina TaxID=1710540 RepID=UPI0015B3B5DB|nr:TRAM domain-containing protein [Natronomonas salina]QLD88190.1 TRAM domain-containing protein [Natronomonas salina]
MEIADRLRCLFSGTIEERDGSYQIEIPKSELELGGVDEGATYQVALLRSPGKTSESTDEGSSRSRDSQAPPVEEGESRQVEIEGIGEQGDGITRVERGFVVIVPDTEKGERVRITITDVRDSVAFAEVDERIDYYE